MGIDAGGTRTRVIWRDVHGAPVWCDHPSVNPASTADPDRVWAAIAGELASTAATADVWVGSAAYSPATADAEMRRIRAAWTAAGLRGKLLLSNDVAPLLLGEPLNGVGVVGSVGTGSSFVARNADGGIAEASGHEFVASDEGSAFDLGRRGLRAAVLAEDGLGLPSDLVARVEATYGMPPSQTARMLAQSSEVKRAVAAFAPQVCASASAGDVVARTVVDRAAADVAHALVVVARRVGLVRPAILLVGGVVEHCHILRFAVKHAVEEALPGCRWVPSRGAWLAALCLAETPALRHAASGTRLQVSEQRLGALESAEVIGGPGLEPG